MKRSQAIIGIPSSLLLLISMLVSYEPGLIFGLSGCFVALVLRQIRLHRYSYRLGHPDRHSDEYGYGVSDDLLDEAEMYERDEKRGR
ncbi:hypothetical protein [Guptibacillus algicola]|uniref:hypothetical protein n=1 Tax=Guptibacillus algicola TaxID=225844 RepID=UPI001CD7EFC4|nr:hypothetical protein [Alkalihalobacillus algicola]MCA0988520.1 hypothetical protein [Alkalihalobacillus algicola]